MPFCWTQTDEQQFNVGTVCTGGARTGMPHCYPASDFLTPDQGANVFLTIMLTLGSAGLSALLGPAAAAGGMAPEAVTAGGGADNVVNGTRLAQQLARESAQSAFTSSGELQPSVIAESRLITQGAKLGNTDLVKHLTSDGSNIADWGKYTTPTFQSPMGDFQVHFYMNSLTGEVDYGYDYKFVLNERG